MNATDPSGLRAVTPLKEFEFIDASGRSVICEVCSDGSVNYYSGTTFTPGQMHRLPHGEVFHEGDATITRVEVIKGMWTTLREDRQAGNQPLSFFERVKVSVASTFLAESAEPTVKYYFSDGTKFIVPSGGPSTGALAGQATALSGLFGAARSAGAAGLGKEVFANVADTAFTEATHIPLGPSMLARPAVGKFTGTGGVLAPRTQSPTGYTPDP